MATTFDVGCCISQRGVRIFIETGRVHVGSCRGFAPFSLAWSGNSSNPDGNFPKRGSQFPMVGLCPHIMRMCGQAAYEGIP